MYMFLPPYHAYNNHVTQTNPGLLKPTYNFQSKGKGAQKPQADQEDCLLSNYQNL